MKAQIQDKIKNAAEQFKSSMSEMPVWFQDLFGGSNIWDMVVNNGLQVIGIGVIGWVLATWFERRHFRDIAEREITLQPISTNTLKRPPPCEPERATLLVGSVVVAHDYFRTLFIFVRKLIGGNIHAYERLLERGRREALLRLKEAANLHSFDSIINVRFTTSVVAGKFITAVEMVAYGTGLNTSQSARIRGGELGAEPEGIQPSR